MQAGYAYDRNTDERFLKSKLKVRKLDKQSYGLYDTIEDDFITMTNATEKPTKKVTFDMNTQAGIPMVKSTTATEIPMSESQKKIILEEGRQKAIADANAEVSVNIMRNVGNPRNITTDAKSEPVKRAGYMGDLFSAVEGVRAGKTPSQIAAENKAKKSSSSKASSADFLSPRSTSNEGPRLNEVSLKDKRSLGVANPERLRPRALLDADAIPRLNNIPTIQTAQIPSNIKPAVLEAARPPDVSNEPLIPSGLPSSPADSPKSATSQGTTVAQSSMVGSLVGNPDIGNLEETNRGPGRPTVELTSEDAKTIYINEYRPIKALGAGRNNQTFRNIASKLLKALYPELLQSEKAKEYVVKKKIDKDSIAGTIKDTPFKYFTKDYSDGKKIVLADPDAETYLDSKQAAIEGSGLKKRLGLAARRPRKGETLPMNSVLLNQLDKGHLNVVTKKGNQVLKQKNISAAFKRIVNDIMKSGTFEAEDYKKIEDIEIPSVNQFIIQSDAVIPPDTPYKTTSDHVKDVKARYNILVGELASGNSGRIVREEMKEILKEMWRLKQITFKAYKSRVNGLKDFE